MKKSPPMWSLNDVRTSTWNEYIIGVDDSACMTVFNFLWSYKNCIIVKISYPAALNLKNNSQRNLTSLKKNFFKNKLPKHI